MAKKSANDPTNKSEFIRQQLRANPTVSAGEVVAAWVAAGNEEFSKALVYHVLNKERSKLAASEAAAPAAKRRGRPKKVVVATVAPSAPPKPAAAVPAAPAPAPVPAPSAPRDSEALLELERQLDTAVFTAERVGEAEIAALVRVARRLVTRKLG